MGGLLAVASGHASFQTRNFYFGGLVVVFLLSLLLWNVILGKDGRLSTSKTVAAVWTWLIGGTLLGAVVVHFVGHPQALNAMMHSGLAGQYGLLIGGPLGSAIAAKALVTSQVQKGTTTKTSPADGANAFQLVQNDAAQTDLGDYQYVLFNLVAMVYFVGALFQDPTSGFPHIPDLLLGLTSVSALSYVAKKAIPTADATAALSSTEGTATTPVTITGAGLLTGPNATTAPVLVVFGTRRATITAQDRGDDGRDSITVTPPVELTAGTAVEVFVITPAPARVSAGKFTRLAS